MSIGLRYDRFMSAKHSLSLNNTTMKKLIILMAVVLLASMSGRADEKLDSVPYLTEHARQGEKWAYEALAECHRYGKGDLKRSLINALTYYNLAGRDVEEYMRKVAQNDPDDPFGMFMRIPDYIESQKLDCISGAVDALCRVGYHSADILVKEMDCRGKMELEDVLQYATDPDTDPDAALFACLGYIAFNANDSVKIKPAEVIPPILGKIPYMYSFLGTDKYQDTIKSDTPDGYSEETRAHDAEERRKAVEYMLKADEYGVLSKYGARLLYHYCTSDPTSGWVGLTEEDYLRLRQIGGISE